MRSALQLRVGLVAALLLCLPAWSVLPVSASVGETAAAAAAALLVLVAAVTVTAVLLAPAGSDRLRPRLIAEERRLRGSFRRQSAPDTPGCPCRPRAPGHVCT